MPKPCPPKQSANGVITRSDGREIASLTVYRERTAEMAARQMNLCAICGNWMRRATFDHESSRGGGKRDDRIIVDGEWHNAALCGSCNTRKGSKPRHWRGGKYVRGLKPAAETVGGQ